MRPEGCSRPHARSGARSNHFAHSFTLLAVVLLCLNATAAAAQERRAQSPAPWAEVPIRYGAIAFTADGSFSTAWKYRSKAAAQAKVATDCARFKRGVCQVVSFGAQVCAAIASFEFGKDRKVTYSGGGFAPDVAQQGALRRCREDGRSGGRCELRAVVCADGR
jgi:Domain of unknown function (DUF4189)